MEQYKINYDNARHNVRFCDTIFFISNDKGWQEATSIKTCRTDNNYARAL